MLSDNEPFPSLNSHSHQTSFLLYHESPKFSLSSRFNFLPGCLLTSFKYSFVLLFHYELSFLQVLPFPSPLSSAHAVLVSQTTRLIKATAPDWEALGPAGI